MLAVFEVRSELTERTARIKRRSAGSPKPCDSQKFKTLVRSSVDDFVTAKATNFHRLQQSPIPAPQNVQQRDKGQPENCKF